MVRQIGDGELDFPEIKDPENQASKYGIKAVNLAKLRRAREADESLKFHIPLGFVIPNAEKDSHQIEQAYNQLTEGLDQRTPLFIRSSAETETPGEHSTHIAWYFPDDPESSRNAFAATVEKVISDTPKAVIVQLPAHTMSPRNSHRGPKESWGFEDRSFVIQSHSALNPDHLTITIAFGCGSQAVDNNTPLTTFDIDRENGEIKFILCFSHSFYLYGHNSDSPRQRNATVLGSYTNEGYEQFEKHQEFWNGILEAEQWLLEYLNNLEDIHMETPIKELSIDLSCLSSQQQSYLKKWSIQESLSIRQTINNLETNILIIQTKNLLPDPGAEILEVQASIVRTVFDDNLTKESRERLDKIGGCYTRSENGWLVQDPQTVIEANDSERFLQPSTPLFASKEEGDVELRRLIELTLSLLQHYTHFEVEGVLGKPTTTEGGDLNVVQIRDLEPLPVSKFFEFTKVPEEKMIASFEDCNAVIGVIKTEGTLIVKTSFDCGQLQTNQVKYLAKEQDGPVFFLTQTFHGSTFWNRLRDLDTSVRLTFGLDNLAAHSRGAIRQKAGNGEPALYASLNLSGQQIEELLNTRLSPVNASETRAESEIRAFPGIRIESDGRRCQIFFK